eukprot:5781107-Pleurochrysis_carterae.AAC.1
MSKWQGLPLAWPVRSRSKAPWMEPAEQAVTCERRKAALSPTMNSPWCPPNATDKNGPGG